MTQFPNDQCYGVALPGLVIGNWDLVIRVVVPSDWFA